MTRKKEKTSQGRHGEAFWEEEKGSFGYKMMHKMGWQRGTGLGKSRQGTTSFVRATLKRDNAGIGATAMSPDDTWAANLGAYNDLLKRLSAAGGDHVADPVAKAAADSAAATSSNKARLESYMAGRRLYSKFKRAKDTSSYSAKHMSEILGKRSSADAPATDEPVPALEGAEGTLSRVSSSSISDYFKSKGGAGGGRSEATSARAATPAQPRALAMTPDEQAKYYDSLMARSQVGGRTGLGFGASSSPEPEPAELALPAGGANQPRGSSVEAGEGDRAARKQSKAEKKRLEAEAKRQRKQARKEEKLRRKDEAKDPEGVEKKKKKKDKKKKKEKDKEEKKKEKKKAIEEKLVASLKKSMERGAKHGDHTPVVDIEAEARRIRREEKKRRRASIDGSSGGGPDIEQIAKRARKEVSV